MKKFLLVLSFICAALPSVAFGAGFAKAPLFLSRTPVTEGQTVRIIAVVGNNAADSFSGVLVFFDDSAKIGSTTVTLQSGATQTASISWKPSAGAHPIKAELMAKDGTVAEQVSATFTINALPQPQIVTSASNSNGQAAASVDSSASIQKDIANVSPQVASAAEPLFTVIDGARTSAANVLDNQLASTHAKLSNTQKPGIVAGASTTADASISNPWGMFWFALYTIYFYILTVLRWLVGNAGVFYPAVAILFLYMLWRIYKRMRRPSY